MEAGSGAQSGVAPARRTSPGTNGSACAYHGVSASAVHANEATPTKAEVDSRLKTVERHLPRTPAKAVHWARKDLAKWARIAIGSTLVIAGVCSFVPIWGYWKIPVGLLLLAKDIPFLRGPMIRFVDWGERKWQHWKRRDGDSGDLAR